MDASGGGGPDRRRAEVRRILTKESGPVILGPCVRLHGAMAAVGSPTAG